MYESDFNWAIGNSAILQKHRELLKTLSDDRVMCVGYQENNNSYYIVECCDEYFGYDLTKEECIELSEMFKEIAEVIK